MQNCWKPGRAQDWGTSAKRNSSYSTYSILFITYTSYFGGKKGISRNKMNIVFLMNMWQHRLDLNVKLVGQGEYMGEFWGIGKSGWVALSGS